MAGRWYVERKAYDLLIQAETALASVTGRPRGREGIRCFGLRYRRKRMH